MAESRILPGHGPRLAPTSTRRVVSWTVWLAAAWSLALAAALWPRPALAATVPGEGPAHVGRLSTVQGDVRWLDRDGGGWLESAPGQPLRNWPVAAGDRLRTGSDARAELRIGSTTLRLGASTELWLQRLDEQALVLHLQAGTVALRLPVQDGDAFGPVELTTREGSWLPQRPGSYRLDRQPDATQGTAWRGELRFEGRDSALTIPAGRRADLWLNPPDSPAAGLTRFAWAPVERDAFSDWVARDERNDDAPVTARYVPPDMTGWQDLDRHGDWITDPEYGSLWQPRGVAPGWAPFHDGRWAWVAPWGWTWIDAAPWGFAPFHYGTWISYRGRWCWSPGPRGQRAHYAPAHSAWVVGPSLGIGIQIGGHRPPPPRVVIPAMPPRYVPPVVVVPLPHRPHVEPSRPPGPEPRLGDRPPERREWRGEERRGENRRGEDRRGEDWRDADRREADRREPYPRGRTGGNPQRPEVAGPMPAAPQAPTSPLVPAGTPRQAPARSPALPAPAAAPIPVAAPSPTPAAVVVPALPPPAPRGTRDGDARHEARGANPARQQDRGERGDRGDRSERGDRSASR